MRKLNLTELEEELEVLQTERLSYIKGGDDSINGGYLPEVYIPSTGGENQNPFSWFNWWNGYYGGGDGTGNEDDGTSGGGGGSYPGTYNGGMLPTVTIHAGVPITNEVWYKVITTMVSGLDVAWAQSFAAAAYLDASLPAWFRGTGTGFALLGAADNIMQMVDHGFNYEDATQAAIGVALVGFSSTLGAPVVFVGGTGLFVWELYEQYRGSN